MPSLTGPRADPQEEPEPQPHPQPEPRLQPEPEQRPVGGAARRPRADRARQVAARATDVAAALLVLAALLLPDRLSRLDAGTFLRIPMEALLAGTLVLLLPRRPARVLAAAAGAVLAVLAVGAALDMGFRAVLVRPFDPVLDWVLLADAEEFLTSSIGRAGAIAVAVGAAFLAVVVVALMVLAALRLARLVRRARTAATGTLVVLCLAWVTCAGLGVRTPTGEPVAAGVAVSHAGDRVEQVAAGLRDRAAFARESSVDAFADVPGDRLLTGLHGKDVLVAFVESYGRSAVEDPRMAPAVDATLDQGTRTLRAAGFSARSAWLTSPTAGGGSWLAHSTLLSGLWIDNQQRYRTVTSSDRLTLNGAFRRAGWRTVGIMPGVTRAWPEGRLYRYDQVYDSHQVGYRGPHFSWAPMPDQYALAAFQRLERDRPGRGPLMADLPLVSSHAPWAPIPRLVGWDDVGDGSVFDPMPGSGQRPDDAWQDADHVRAAYARSIQYSLRTLVSYLTTYGDDRLVVVLLGDHQPAPIVTGDDAGREVPVTVVARDPAVLDRIAGWGWQDGLRPAAGSPVWRMDGFRDRFLHAFGPRPAG